MMSFKRCFIFSAVISLLPLLLVTSVHAEERKKSKAEQMATAPSDEPVAVLGTKRRGKLTEEQAVNQLKYMMVQGWARMERELVETKSFTPFGLTLSPDGDFKPLFVESGVGALRIKSDFALAAIIENLKAIAETRAVWAVGIIYIQAEQLKDGSYVQRIQVMTEHIAGWARHWSYPFKVTDGEVKLGAPVITPVKTTYFKQSK